MESVDIGRIIITDNINDMVNSIKENYQNYKIFNKNEFKIDDAKEVINESYISSTTQKVIIIASETFNVYAQNALLKILEEPPKNIKFILITKSKNAVLPTIKSRMILINKKKNIKHNLLGIKPNLLKVGDIVNHINTLSSNDRKQVRDNIQSLLFEIKESNIKLNNIELNAFSNAVEQNENYCNSKYIFLELLLTILKHNNHRNKMRIMEDK